MVGLLDVVRCGGSVRWVWSCALRKEEVQEQVPLSGLSRTFVGWSTDFSRGVILFAAAFFGPSVDKSE
jgi:hypothetical protein